RRLLQLRDVDLLRRRSSRSERAGLQRLRLYGHSGAARMAGRDDARSGSGACQARRPRLLRPRLALGSCRRLHRRWAGSGQRLGERPQPLADRLSTRSRRDPLVLLTVAGRVTRRVGLLPPLAVAALLSAPVAVA